ncbi:hypothetical protein ACLB2K_023074 [Fragaria x ananassa]
MCEECYQGKSLLNPGSTSKLGLPISNVITDWLKSLPEELIPDILLRLPIKSLIRFTSVSKSWNSTIKHPTFIRNHTLNFSDQNATHLLLLHTLLSNEDSSNPYGIELINACLRAVGTCNGLVFLADDLKRCGDTFVIWNPSVRKYVTLPQSSVRFSTHGIYTDMSGLGYDAIGNDYKVVRLTTLNNVTDDGPSIAQVFVNGALHWPAYNKQYFVLTFDVASESFGEINLPMRFQSNFPEDLMLSASGDRKSIALFHSMRWNNKGDYFLDIWVMKEYSEEQSWTKLLVLSLQGPERSPAEALCFKRSGEVILVRLDSLELVSLDLVSKQFKALGISGGQFCSVHCYEESLVLLDTKDAVSY